MQPWLAKRFQPNLFQEWWRRHRDCRAIIRTDPHYFALDICLFYMAAPHKQAISLRFYSSSYCYFSFSFEIRILETAIINHKFLTDSQSGGRGTIQIQLRFLKLYFVLYLFRVKWKISIVMHLGNRSKNLNVFRRLWSHFAWILPDWRLPHNLVFILQDENGSSGKKAMENVEYLWRNLTDFS